MRALLALRKVTEERERLADFRFGSLMALYANSKVEKGQQTYTWETFFPGPEKRAEEEGTDTVGILNMFRYIAARQKVEA